MKTETINGTNYRLPDELTPFQKEMYVHLINWKWQKLGIQEPGIYKYKGEDILYDAILPKTVHKNYPLIYPSILDELLQHQKSFPFKLHQHFNHMASSQAANVNLFLPILLSPIADVIFRQINPDFKSLEKGELYKGFRIEFWDGNGKDKGLLGDHNARSGTDSDIGIAYRNNEDELCLWLIEHKLTEKEFTVCGGAKSKGRDSERHNCNHTLSEIITKKSLCYYHDVRKNNYWTLTEKHKGFFANHHKFSTCPFQGGMNQLWRNQLLAMALESEGRYKHVYFSVVRHPGNHALDYTISEYRQLVNNNPKFSDFNSKTVVDIVKMQDNSDLSNWVNWYCKLYKIN